MDLFYLLLNQQEFSCTAIDPMQKCPGTLQSQVVLVEASPTPSPTLKIEKTEYQFFLKSALLSQLITDLFKAESMSGRNWPTDD